MQGLLGLVTQFVVQHSYQIKFVKSICLFQVRLPITSPFGTKTKQATQTLRDALMNMDKTQRRLCPPPCVVVIGTLLETCCELAALALP